MSRSLKALAAVLSLILVASLIVPLVSWAEGYKPPGFKMAAPNDSCSISLKTASCEAYMCDSGLFRQCHPKGERVKLGTLHKVTDKQWSEMFDKIGTEARKSRDTAAIKNVQVPDSSCGYGFHLRCTYLACRSGLFKSCPEQKEFAPVNLGEWNRSMAGARAQDPGSRVTEGQPAKLEAGD